MQLSKKPDPQEVQVTAAMAQYFGRDWMKEYPLT